MSQAVIIIQVTKKFGKPMGPFWKRVLNGRSSTNAHKHTVVAGAVSRSPCRKEKSSAGPNGMLNGWENCTVMDDGSSLGNVVCGFPESGI